MTARSFCISTFNLALLWPIAGFAETPLERD